MGFFGRDSITEFSRELLVCRLEMDPVALQSGFDVHDVATLGRLQLMALPEATIATILESVYSNLNDPSILQRIERHRSRIGSLRTPIPDSIEDYVLKRVELEHPDAISTAHVKLCISACHYFFGIDGSIGNAKFATERARWRQAEMDLHATWAAIIDRFVEASISEDDFLGRIDEVYERLAPIIEHQKRNKDSEKSHRRL